ncbi:hypothetical protein ACF1A5_31895 [Streptomyces sp. NPDC014864]
MTTYQGAFGRAVDEEEAARRTAHEVKPAVTASLLIESGRARWSTGST